jgi:uncharacterized protein DUF6602
MPNPLFVNDLALRIESAITAARHASGLEHPGLTGTVREILVRELIRPLLPPHIGIGTGKIVDHIGNASAEVDVVVYDRSVLPPLLYGQETSLGAFPVEACLYAIQVKSTSSLTNLREVVEQGRSLAKLVYLREACGPNGNPLRRVVPAYFAFSTDLRSPSEDGPIPEIERWRGEHASADFQYEDVWTDKWQTVPYPPVRVLCVVGQGYGFYTGEHYATFAASRDRAEVVTFITGIANTLLRPSPRNRGLPFGYYLGGLTQAEAEPAPGTRDQVVDIVRALAARVGRFDANDAARAVFDARLKYRGPDTVLGNITEVTEALVDLERCGDIRRVNRESTGPHEWEYIACRPPRPQ